MSLEDFLNMDKDEEIKEIEFPRMKLTFKIRNLSAEEMKEISVAYSKEHFRKISKRNEEDMEYTTGLILKQLVVSIIEPHLEDERLMKRYGTTDLGKILLKMLRPGEYLQLLKAFNELNRVDTEIQQEDIDEAKN